MGGLQVAEAVERAVWGSQSTRHGPMFDNLTDKLQRAFKHLRGQGTLTEEKIQESLREIRVALLEADVNLNVVKDLIEHTRAKAVGTEVLTALRDVHLVYPTS